MGGYRQMSTDIIDGLDVDRLRMMRRIRKLWREFGIAGPVPFGPSGVVVTLMLPSGGHAGSIIVTQATHEGAEWLHASVAFDGEMPAYEDLTALKDAVFGPEREAYQVFPPAAEHVSIHDFALHLWGRADGRGVLPRFSRGMTI